MVGNIKVQCEFYSFRLDYPRYRQVALSHLRNLNERAGKAWLKTALDETPIPTWSGASRATFMKLASELGTSVPLGPIRAKKNRVALGKSTSAGSGVIEDKNAWEIGFKYETDLRYLHYNEYNTAVAGPPPQPYSNNVRFTPYNFQKRAADQWEHVAKTAKLPNPYRYLRIRKI